MMSIVEASWLLLHAGLSVFAEKLSAADPALVSELGLTANDAFFSEGTWHSGETRMVMNSLSLWIFRMTASK